MIKFFNENIESEILKIKNIKSNLIMGLPSLDEKEKEKYFGRIWYLELKIVDFELKRKKYEKAARNLKNAMKFIKLDKKNHILKKIQLRGLIEENFPEKFRNELGLKLKLNDKESEDTDLISLNNMYAFILEKFHNEKLKITNQTSNKAHLFLFQTTPFHNIMAVSTPDIKISSHPLYSEKFADFFEHCQNQWNIFSIKENIIIPNIHYSILESKIRGFRTKIRRFDKDLLKIYEEKLNLFSNFKTDQIKDWENRTKILEFYSLNSII